MTEELLASLDSPNMSLDTSEAASDADTDLSFVHNTTLKLEKMKSHLLIHYKLPSTTVMKR